MYFWGIISGVTRFTKSAGSHISITGRLPSSSTRHSDCSQIGHDNQGTITNDVRSRTASGNLSRWKSRKGLSRWSRSSCCQRGTQLQFSDPCSSVWPTCNAGLAPTFRAHLCVCCSRTQNLQSPQRTYFFKSTLKTCYLSEFNLRCAPPAAASETGSLAEAGRCSAYDSLSKSQAANFGGLLSNSSLSSGLQYSDPLRSTNRGRSRLRDLRPSRA